MQTTPTILVVDPSPSTHVTLQWAWVGCRVLAYRSLGEATAALTREQPLMVVLDLSLEGIAEFYDRAPEHLRERLLFVGEGPGTPAQRRLAARMDVPLLYKPLSLQVLHAAYEAFQPLDAARLETGPSA